MNVIAGYHVIKNIDLITIFHQEQLAFIKLFIFIELEEKFLIIASVSNMITRIGQPISVSPGHKDTCILLILIFPSTNY